MLLTRTDLLPHLDFDPVLAHEIARKVHADIDYITLSARTGEGILPAKALLHNILSANRSQSQFSRPVQRLKNSQK
jgi:hypothetical protein